MTSGVRCDVTDSPPAVSGFGAWNKAFLGTVNHFGGFEDLPLFLSKQGYTVILVRIGPLSTHRDRACEIFAQLTNIRDGE